MNKILLRKSTMKGAALSAVLLGSVMVAQAGPLPPERDVGGIAVVSGGIGEGEASAIQAASRHWPLTLEFAVAEKPRAEYAANVSVVVRDAQGRVALQTESSGPFMLARMAPGHYVVDATLKGNTLHRSVVVKSGQAAKATFVWPAGTDGTGS